MRKSFFVIYLLLDICAFLTDFQIFHSEQFGDIPVRRSRSAFLLPARLRHPHSHDHLPINHHRRHVCFGDGLLRLHPPPLPKGAEDVRIEAVCDGGGRGHQRGVPHSVHFIFDPSCRVNRVVGVSFRDADGDGGDPDDISYGAVQLSEGRAAFIDVTSKHDGEDDVEVLFIHAVNLIHFFFAFYFRVFYSNFLRKTPK